MAENNTQQPKVEDKITIDCEPYLPFVAMNMRTIIDADTLATEISSRLFRKIFFEYVGCSIEFGPTMLSNGVPILDLTLHFNYNPELDTKGKLRNIINAADPSAVKNENSMFKKVNVVQKRYEGTSFILNNETKEILLSVMRQDLGPRSVEDGKWKKAISMISVPAGNGYQRGAEISYLKVCGLNLNEVAKKLFGPTMVTSTVKEEGRVINKTAEARYQVSVHDIKPNGKIVLEVHCFDDTANGGPTMYQGNVMPFNIK